MKIAPSIAIYALLLASAPRHARGKLGAPGADAGNINNEASLIVHAEAQGSHNAGVCILTRKDEQDGQTMYSIELGSGADFDNYVILLMQSDAYLEALLQTSNSSKSLVLVNCTVSKKPPFLVAVESPPPTINDDMLREAGANLARSAPALKTATPKQSWSDRLKTVQGVDAKDVRRLS
jgi:hypothetical protein